MYGIPIFVLLKHNIFEHAVLIDPDVRPNALGTDQLFIRVVARQQRICKNPQLFLALQYRL